MSWNPNAPNPCVPQRLQDICDHYITYSFANTCRCGCPYCFADPEHKGKSRDWTYDQALIGWRNVAEKYGPCWLLFTGLEPMEELPFVANVLKDHYAQCCTNLMFDEEELYRLVPPERLDIHPTFHPHRWLADVNKFFDKVKRIQDHGYVVPLIAMVGWPDYLPYWDEWIARINDMGISPNPVPARNTTYHGQPLPDAYTEKDLEVLNRYCSTATYDEKGVIRPLNIIKCAAGVAACTIMPNGDVNRCAQMLPPGGMGGQNLYRDGGLTFLTEPLPCAESQCRCNNLHPFHITE